MSAQLRFSPALGDWIRGSLDQGWAADALVETLQARAMAPAAAHALVAAFARARNEGLPPPHDAVDVPEEGSSPERANTPYLPSSRSIQTRDRTVRIAARATEPVLAVMNDVIDAAECEELIAMARPRLTPSTLVDPATGLDVVTDQRNSWGMFFRPLENALIARLDRRFAELMNQPFEHGEGLQVLHYPLGAGSAPHFDFLVPSNAANQASIARSGQRVSTLVTYLNDVPAGGETVFPAVGWAVSPQRGNAVYFEYTNRAGKLDHASLHASQPVLEGEKWVATKWMRARPFVSA